MFGLGMGEMVLIGAIALLVIGPEKLPHLMRELGRWYGQLRRAADDLRRAFVLEADRQDAAERYRQLQERRKLAQQERLRAQEEGARAQPEVSPPSAPQESAPSPEHPPGEAGQAALDDLLRKEGPVPNDLPPDAPHPGLNRPALPNDGPSPDEGLAQDGGLEPKAASGERR